jgi:glycosyltransferase involved in cell wall biosynthesis
MTAPVTVITPTIPGRSKELARCLESVYAQTVPVAGHIIVAQQRAVGIPRQLACARAQNLALAAVETPWVVRLEDDDQLTPGAVEALLGCAGDADVVYGPEANGVCGVEDLNGYTAPAMVEFFRHLDTGQASGDMYRTVRLQLIGGWVTNWHRDHFHHSRSRWCLHPYEDRATRAVLAQVGCRFRYCPTPTWVAGVDGPDRIGQQQFSWQACA